MRTSIGSSVCDALSANTSAVPSRKSATSTTTIETVPVTIDAAMHREDDRPSKSTATTTIRRSSRSDRAPAYSPNTQRREPLQRAPRGIPGRRRRSGRRRAAARPQARTRRPGCWSTKSRAASGSRPRAGAARRCRRAGSQPAEATTRGRPRTACFGPGHGLRIHSGLTGVSPWVMSTSAKRSRTRPGRMFCSAASISAKATCRGPCPRRRRASTRTSTAISAGRSTLCGESIEGPRPVRVGPS